MSILSITIPNLLKNPYIIQPITLNNTLYFFRYRWNIRHARAYLSIYTKVNEEIIYLVKNICLIPQLNISRHIYNEDWKGVLSFVNIINSIEEDYRQDNIHTEFNITYVLED